MTIGTLKRELADIPEEFNETHEVEFGIRQNGAIFNTHKIDKIEDVIGERSLVLLIKEI